MDPHPLPICLDVDKDGVYILYVGLFIVIWFSKNMLLKVCASYFPDYIMSFTYSIQLNFAWYQS